MTKFNLLRYRKLNIIVEKQNEFLLDDRDYNELLYYESIIGTQIFYKNRKKYFDLIKKYLDER